MKLFQKLLCCIITCSLLVIPGNLTCSADVSGSKAWIGWFGASDTPPDSEYYMTRFVWAEGRLIYPIDTEFRAKISIVGFGGCWGGRAYKDDIQVKKNHTYKLSFCIKSYDVNKYVYVALDQGGEFGVNPAYSFWIKCPKGDKLFVEKTFVAKEDASRIAFGIGGDPGDREDVEADVDAAYRYSVFDSQGFGFNHKDLSKYDCDGDFVSFTDILMNEFELKEASNTDEVVNTKVVKIKSIKAKKRSLLVKWKKVKGVTGYQIQCSLKKNFKKKTKSVYIGRSSITSKTIKKLKKKKKYYVRMRTFIDTGERDVFSAWSKTKTKKTK